MRGFQAFRKEVVLWTIAVLTNEVVPPEATAGGLSPIWVFRGAATRSYGSPRAFYERKNGSATSRGAWFPFGNQAPVLLVDGKCREGAAAASNCASPVWGLISRKATGDQASPKNQTGDDREYHPTAGGIARAGLIGVSVVVQSLHDVPPGLRGWRPTTPPPIPVSRRESADPECR